MTWWDRQHHLWQHLLALCLLSLRISSASCSGASRFDLPNTEWCPSGNNPAGKISLQEMGFLTCRLHSSEMIVCVTNTAGSGYLATCICLTLSIISPPKTHTHALLNGKKVNFSQKMLWSLVPLKGLGIFKSLRASFWTISKVTFLLQLARMWSL